MAFMIPVVRNNWEVLDSGKNRSSNKSTRQDSGGNSRENLSSTPSRNGSTVVPSTHIKQTLGTQNRQHSSTRITSGSLPSNVHAVHLTSDGQVCASAIPPHVYKSICGSYPGNQQRIGQIMASQTKVETVSTVSLPAATQDTSSSIKRKSSRRGRWLDRLRRSMRLNSGSSSDEADNPEGDNGTRASS